jgi:transcription elongation factor SPT6
VIEKQDASSSFVLCKLDNGLDAKIDCTKLDLNNRQVETIVK